MPAKTSRARSPRELHVRVTEDLYRAMQTRARQQGVTLASLVKGLLWTSMNAGGRSG